MGTTRARIRFVRVPLRTHHGLLAKLPIQDLGADLGELHPVNPLAVAAHVEAPREATSATRVRTYEGSIVIQLLLFLLLGGAARTAGIAARRAFARTRAFRVRRFGARHPRHGAVRFCGRRLAAAVPGLSCALQLHNPGQAPLLRLDLLHRLGNLLLALVFGRSNADDLSPRRELSRVELGLHGVVPMAGDLRGGATGNLLADLAPVYLPTRFVVLVHGGDHQLILLFRPLPPPGAVVPLKLRGPTGLHTLLGGGQTFLHRPVVILLAHEGLVQLLDGRQVMRAALRHRPRVVAADVGELLLRDGVGYQVGVAAVAGLLDAAEHLRLRAAPELLHHHPRREGLRRRASLVLDRQRTVELCRADFRRRIGLGEPHERVQSHAAVQHA
mmetsp:Transcript_2948/g.11947  ORF Transcript_2948/g.11947 Transcript_2948/m.11947 type:complete len:386 (-) Transcript_2948:197-1354(-)